MEPEKLDEIIEEVTSAMFEVYMGEGSRTVYEEERDGIEKYLRDKLLGDL